MKKIIAILMLLCMFSTAALAEAAEINWSDVEPVIANSELEGDFVTFEELGLKIWLPGDLQPVELSDEDAEGGILYAFSDANQEAAVILSYTDAEGLTLEQFAEGLEAAGAQDIALEKFNGLDGLEYTQPDADAVVVAFPTDAGNFLLITMSPVSVEGADVVWGIVGASIQAA